MKKIIHKMFPYLGPKLHIIIGFFYDMKKFIKSSHSIKPLENKQKLEAILIRNYHGIEKALSLPNPRLGFGQKLVAELIKDLSEYYSRYGYTVTVKAALDNLNIYSTFNNNTTDLSLEKIKTKITNLNKLIVEQGLGDNKIGGYHEVKKSDIINISSAFNFKQFSDSRYSIRDFATGEVSIDLIREAIKIASKSPSACNRQPWKVHVFKGQSKEHILNFQNGNRGFRDSINTVILITGLTSSFSHSERHEAWVDGGIFTMALMFAFHSFGLGTCALNTSYTYKGEIALRKAINLKIEEEPITMLAIGHLKDSFNVALSPRKMVDEIIVIE